MVSEICVAPTRTMAAFIVSQKPPQRPFDIKIWTLDLNSGAVAPTTLETSLGFTPFSWSPDASVLAYKSHDESSIRLFDLRSLSESVVSASAPSKAVDNRPRFNTVHFSPTGKYLGYLSGNTLRIHNFAARQSMDAVHAIESDNWCWLANGEEILFNKDARLHRMNVSSGKSEVVYSPKLDSKDDFQFPYLTLSPDPDSIGFYAGKTFYALDLNNKSADPLFTCDHWFTEFDWRESGIVYLDAANGNRRKRARLMVFDPSTKTSREIAVGPFAFASWAQGDTIIARSGRSQIVLIDGRTGASRLLFDAQAGTSNTKP